MESQIGIRVYSAPVLASVMHIKHILEMNGIESEVRGEFRAAGAGDIPFIEAWPELWVLNNEDGKEAERLVQEVLAAGETSQPEWECPECGESVEGQFAQCWSCGAKAPEASSK